MQEANNDTKKNSSNMYCKFKQCGKSLIYSFNNINNIYSFSKHYILI